MRKIIIAIVIILIALDINAVAQFGNPFSVEAELSHQDTNIALKVSFSVPDKHHLYKDKISVQGPDNVTVTPKNIPDAIKIKDPETGETSLFYEHDVALLYHLGGQLTTPLDITVEYMGCNDKICFRPQTKTFQLSLPGLQKPHNQKPPSDNNKLSPPTPQIDNWRDIADTFRVTGITSGYLTSESFLTFLDGNTVTDKGSSNDDDLTQRLRDMGVWVSMIIIIFLGLGLNLTPCVLPMIPINLAIIGAGSQSGSRGRGFALGATYGAGIALVYGILGLIVIFTSAQFGTLNSTPWFNICIAILFFSLSLAMFGIFNIDLTRFQSSSGGSKSKRGSFLTALRHSSLVLA